MKPQARSRLLALGAVVVAISALVAALGALSFATLSEAPFHAEDSYYTPSELLSEREEAPRGALHVSGVVKPGSITWDQAHGRVTFELSDRQAPDAPGIKVSASPSPARPLRDGLGVLAEGTLTPAGELASERIMVEHDARSAPAAGEARPSFGEAIMAALALARRGDPGPKGDPGPPGDAGPAGPPGVGWADAGADLVTTNSGNVGIGTLAPAAKLDVDGEVNAAGLRFRGTQVLALERSGMVTDVARGKLAAVTQGTIDGAGPTSEYAENSRWRAIVFPAELMLDLGRPVPFIVQIAWESSARGNATAVPEWEGGGAYVLQYSADGSSWVQVPPVAPVDGDLFVHTLRPPPSLVRFIRLTVLAPRVTGSAVHVSMLRAFSFAAGDSTGIDARRLYLPPGIGPVRAWGEGRPGAVRYGTTGVEQGLCINSAAGVRFGLSNVKVYWEGARAACPAGTWVCTLAERGTGPCDTTRPDTTCDLRYATAQCENDPPGGHFGHVADIGSSGAPLEGRYVGETGGIGRGGLGNYSMPSWCCSP